MKQKRKIEEIPDCYHQSMGWGNLHYPLVENIAERADILSTGRLARGMIGMRHAIRGAHKVPFGLPSLLHCDPETWPDDRDNTGIHALLMPLDKPTVPAFIHTKEELDGHGPMHWVGCNGDWVAFVQQDGHLTIRNIYISDTIIPLPSLQDAGISLGPTSEWWHGSPPFLFKYKIDKSLELLKVRIVKRPYKDDLAGPWHYEVIVVFDELIAILQAPLEKEWNILRNPEFFDRNSYVDAMGIPGYGTHAAPRLIDAPVIEDEEAEVAAIFAQIEGDAVMEDDEANVAQGDGGADEDNDADEEELEEEELEEDEFDDEELDDEELDDDGDNHNYEDEDVFLGFSDQRTWFLAPMRAESITGESDLAWIQVKGYRPILGPPILHMGNKLRSYPLDPLYPEGHPKRVEQDSQRTKETSSPSKKKKKKHKTVVESSEPVNDPNSISISDAETESGNEHDKDNDKNDTPDKEEIEKEPEKHAKNKKYTKEDFIAKKHGKCIEIKTVDHVLPEAYIEKTPFPAKMKEYSVITSVVNKSAKKPIEPEEQIKVEPAVAIVKDLVTENVEDGHIIFCEDASNIVSHPNKSRKASVPVLSVRIGDHCYYGLCDIGASISAIPYELYTEIMHEIGSGELEDINVVIHLANRETISPIGIVRDVEVLRDCKKEKIVTKFAGESYEFNFSKFAKTPYKADLPNDDFRVEQCASIALAPNNPLQQHLEDHESEVFREERDELDEIFLRQPILKHDLPVEDLGVTPPPKEDPVFDLKPLPDNLKYAYIDDKKTYPVIISAKLSDFEEERLLEILKKHRGAIGYTLDDLKGISPAICQHAINMEDDAKPVVEHQRRLIPKMKDVVRNEVLKLLEDMASPINFNQFLEKEKLKSNGSNFTDWFRHVRIFLNGGNLQYVLDAPLGDPPAETETDEVKNVYATRKTRYSQVQCAILCSLESDLQKRFEHHDPHELIKELKTIFETHAAVECYEASKHFFSCMMEEGSSISEHMLVMTGHAKKLSDLGIVIPNRLGINRVLQSLPPSYKNFVMNYNMQNMNKEFPELFGMLKAAEIEIKKEHQVLMVNKTTSFKKQGKSKGKFKKGGKKAATPPMKPKNGPKPDADCYYCKEKGHWKRNCSKYLADLKSGLVKKKKEGISDIHELKNKRQLLKDEVTMRVGNGSKVNVIAVGTLPLHLPSGLVLSLNNCYYVPALSMNIISGSCLMQDGYSFKSENNGCSIFMNNIFYGRAPEKNGLFLLDLDSSDTHIHNIDAKRIKLNDNSTYMWHCRLGHIGVKRMKKLHTDGLLESLDFESLDRCEACLMGKMTKTPFSGMMERATDLLEIIHTDVCGPMSVASRGGYRYVLTFTDDLSRYGYIYLMKHKSETFEKFKEFQSEVENQRNKKIKFLRSDRGGEYLSYEFGMHLKKCGILSQLTPPGTPQRNAAFTLNRAPSKSVETTPYELWFNKKPKLSFLKVWGCEAYVKKLQPDKLEPKAEKCVFIGYPKETIGYTFYHRSEGKIFVAKNGTFLEKEFLTKEVTGRKVELDEIEESLLVDQSSAVPENVPVPPTPTTEEANDNDHETSNETATEPRRSTRDRATPDWYDPCLNVMIVDNNDEDPATYEEAMMSPDSNKWQEAMKSEMGSMYDNKVWTLVDLPDSRKAVENKWIKRKTDADGNITVYKARLVAKGFRQIQGVDYDETFSPVAKLKSVRILLAIAAFFDYEIWQMDVKTAFLNGDIEEELYMVQPKGFVDPKNADKVCKLQRSIYGLKQASRSWNRRFDKVIKDFGFIQCHGEACIYKKVSGSSVAFLILYVDDILLIGNDIELLSSVKGYLNNSFSMKDLGEASYILGIKIYRDRSRRLIGLSQSTYLDKILKKFRMDESKKGFLPMLPGKVLSKTQGPATAEERERMSQIPYASAVGSIMYAMLCTRPDIAHAVSLTSRYQSDPGMEHWTAVKNILKYLKRTKDMFLCYGGDQELVVTSYTDASWNTDPDDSKSQSG
ncbi:hypothetical protein QYE76_011506, partial [Lolium multiflorum]